MSGFLTPDQRTIAAQRERIEELEEELRQLRELLAPKRTFPSEWRLQPAHQRLLSAMLDTPGGCINLDRAQRIISIDSEIGPDINTVRVRICAMRKILSPLGVAIVTRWGGGYELTPPSKAIIKAALEQRMAS